MRNLPKETSPIIRNFRANTIRKADHTMLLYSISQPTVQKPPPPPHTHTQEILTLTFNLHPSTQSMNRFAQVRWRCTAWSAAATSSPHFAGHGSSLRGHTFSWCSLSRIARSKEQNLHLQHPWAILEYYLMHERMRRKIVPKLLFRLVL